MANIALNRIVFIFVYLLKSFLICQYLFEKLLVYYIFQELSFYLCLYKVFFIAYILKEILD